MVCAEASRTRERKDISISLPYSGFKINAGLIVASIATTSDKSSLYRLSERSDISM